MTNSPNPVPALFLLLLPSLLGGGCAHTYSLELAGQAVPGARVGASYWAQQAEEVIPQQQAGAAVDADAQGAFTVVSRTEIQPQGFTIPGPPPYITLDVTGPLPLCVVVPTAGIWDNARQRFVVLPALRALTPEEVAYELPVPGLSAPLKVLRLDPAQGSCVPPRK